MLALLEPYKTTAGHRKHGVAYIIWLDWTALAPMLTTNKNVRISVYETNRRTQSCECAQIDNDFLKDEN